MPGRPESGRSRATVVLLLGLGIALLGALLLPRLLDEAHPPDARLAQASICFAAIQGAAPPAGGPTRAIVRVPGGLPIRAAVDLHGNVAPDQVAVDLATALREAARRGGEPDLPGMAAVGACLHLESVVAVGGDPGRVGLEVAYALAARTASGSPIRLELARPGGEGPGPSGRLGLSAQRAAKESGERPGGAALQVAFGADDGAQAILDRLGDALGEAGWSYVAVDGGLVLRGLPDGGSLGGVMLSIRYDTVPATPGARLLWTLAVDR